MKALIAAMTLTLGVVICTGANLSARLVDIYGLHPAFWAQKGNQPIKLDVWDCTTSPEWPAIIGEVVDAWDGAPFALQLIHGTAAQCAVEHPGAIRIAEAGPDALPYGGATWMYIDNRSKMMSAVIGVLPASAYVATELHDDHWYKIRVMGHEMGNALTVGESGPHDDWRNDTGCIMGYQDGIAMNTPFDHSLLCQRYNCGR